MLALVANVVLTVVLVDLEVLYVVVVDRLVFQVVVVDCVVLYVVVVLLFVLTDVLHSTTPSIMPNTLLTNCPYQAKSPT